MPPDPHGEAQSDRSAAASETADGPDSAVGSNAAGGADSAGGADFAGGTSQYQSLYRRFRPRRFEDVLGQENVSQGLRTSVREGRIGHAYLFSGPRGTGKTSAARILAMALNCEAPADGEPCGVCASCVEIARGSSLDVHELDAASNNKIEPMRELVARAALGTPGRWKVYIVDEVHMLTAAASNALLKTLEEPPAHVVFVLATTDPQKVLETVRSRTQHYEFRLLDPDTLAGLLRRVAAQSQLRLPDGAIEAAVRRARGSARDALSALDQIASGGIVEEETRVISDLADAIADRDTHSALVAVEKAVLTGRDPQRLSSELVEELRQGFLAAVAPDLMSVTGADRETIESRTRRMGLPALVRAMETIGRAQVDMRESPDARVHLEVAVAKLTHPEADDSLTALVERIDRLERTVGPTARGGGSGGSGAVGPDTVSKSTGSPGGTGKIDTAEGESGKIDTAEGESDTSSGSKGEQPASGPNLARKALGAIKAEGQPDRPGTSSRSTNQARTAVVVEEGPIQTAPRTTGPPVTTPAPAPTPRATHGATAAAPTREALVQAWGDTLLKSLPGKARAYFGAGRWLSVQDDVAVFALPNEPHRSSCESEKVGVESVLQGYFGLPLKLRLAVDADDGPDSSRNIVSSTGRDSLSPESVTVASTPPTGTGPLGSRGSGPEALPAISPDLLDPEVLAAETEPAGSGPSITDRLKLAFPGAEEV